MISPFTIRTKNGSIFVDLDISMKYVFSLFIVFSILVIAGSKLYAQGNYEENLATQYYQNGEFAKAQGLYKALFDQNPGNLSYYDKYLDCLVNLVRSNCTISRIQGRLHVALAELKRGMKEPHHD